MKSPKHLLRIRVTDRVHDVRVKRLRTPVKPILNDGVQWNSVRAVAVCDVDPPGLEQPIMPMGAGSAGLVPGAAISVAPRGMPVEPTGAPPPKARGDVAASGCVPIVPTWARAEPQLRNAAAKVAVANSIFMLRPSIDVNSRQPSGDRRSE